MVRMLREMGVDPSEVAGGMAGAGFVGGGSQTFTSSRYVVEASVSSPRPDASVALAGVHPQKAVADAV